MNKFEIKPDLVSRGIRNYQSYLISNVVPELERQAIQILISSDMVDPAYYNPPGPADGEAWRLFWVNEASQQCDADDFDRDYLKQVERAAVNVLVTASALRDSLEYGTPGQAAALAMVLLSDAVIGGLSIDLVSTAEHLSNVEADLSVASDKLSANKLASRLRYDKGPGKKQYKFDIWKRQCIEFAVSVLNQNPMLRIGEVAEKAIEHIRTKSDEEETPDASTVAKWLRGAASSSVIQFHESGLKRGRPKKMQ